MSSLSPFTTANILPPTIPPIGPSLSSESEDDGDRIEKQIKLENVEIIPGQATTVGSGI